MQDKALENLFLKQLWGWYIKRRDYTFYIRGVSDVSLQRINAGVLRGPNLSLPGISRSGKGYSGLLKPFFRFHMEILFEKLLERRMKEMILFITIMWFLNQALWWCGMHSNKWRWKSALSQRYNKYSWLYTHS